MFVSSLRNFMADAAKAEFSRDGNPLYSPNHAPIQLPIHLEGRSLDLKIPQPPVRMHSHPGVSQSSTGVSQSQLSSSLPGLQMLGYNENEKTVVNRTDDGSGRSEKVQNGGEDDGVKCDWSGSTNGEHSGPNRSSGVGFQDGVKCDWSGSTNGEHSGPNRSSGVGFQDEQ